MGEQVLFSRRAAAMLPLTAVCGRAGPVTAPAGADAALIDVGARWRIACGKLHDHDMATAAMPIEQMDVEFENLGDRLYKEEWPLFDQALQMPSHSIEGLAVKARLLARAFDVLDPSVASLEAAMARSVDFQDNAALAVALDILRLAKAIA